MKDLKEKLTNFLILINKFYQEGKKNKIEVKDQYSENIEDNNFNIFLIFLNSDGESIRKDCGVLKKYSLVPNIDKKNKAIFVDKKFYDGSFTYGYSSSLIQDSLYYDNKLYDRFGPQFYFFPMEQLSKIESAAKNYNNRGWFKKPNTKPTYKIVDVTFAKTVTTYKIYFGKLSVELTKEEIQKLHSEINDANDKADYNILEKFISLLKNEE